MKKALAVFLFMVVLLPPVLASPPAQGNEFMGKFLKAINTGNYSLIEPYMGQTLREQFTEDYFEQVREFTIANYGKLKGYRLLKNETSGDLVKFTYTVIAEKGSFPVLLAYKNGQLVGIALGVKPKPSPLGMIATMLGSLIVLALIWPFKKLSPSELVLGAGIALILSVVIPFYAISSLLLIPSPLERSLVVATLSALTIEGLKLYFSRNRDGLSLGLGLGLGQYVLLAIGTFVATNFIMKLPVSFSGGAGYAFLEALLFTSFHALSASAYTARGWRPFPLFALLELGVLYLMGVGSYSLALGLLLISVAVAFKPGGASLGIT
jgi:hypothetical protein